jgi:alanine-synthesizing transaminase
MAGPPSELANQFERLASLPPYVLAAVDELKSKLRAQGHDVFDFGLGNPDGPSPKAVIERLVTEAQRAGNQRYMPSKGMPEVRRAICDWYARKYDQTFDPESEAVVTIGAKEGLAHLFLAIIGRGDCVLSPDPCYPIHRYGIIIAGGEPVAVATGPDKDAFAEIEKALARASRKPKGLVVNFPHNPTSAVVDAKFYEKVVALAKREKLWVVSDLAYADLLHDGRPAPSIFQVPGARDVAVEFFTVSKSYSMPGWRVGFCVGNRALVGALTTIKGYLDYGMFGPTQLAAATALTSCDADVVENRERYKHRSKLLVDGLAKAGWHVPLPTASMFVWAPVPKSHAPLGAVGFASALLEQARVAVSPGVGFGPGGEGYVRFALIEPDDRAQRACAAIGEFLAAKR